MHIRNEWTVNPKSFMTTLPIKTREGAINVWCSPLCLIVCQRDLWLLTAGEFSCGLETRENDDLHDDDHGGLLSFPSSPKSLRSIGDASHYTVVRLITLVFKKESLLMMSFAMNSHYIFKP